MINIRYTIKKVADPPRVRSLKLEVRVLRALLLLMAGVAIYACVKCVDTRRYYEYQVIAKGQGDGL